MTPYQRGYRDAMRRFAVDLDERADEYEALAVRVESGRAFTAGKPFAKLYRNCVLNTAATLQSAADSARFQADRPPTDPEENTP